MTITPRATRLIRVADLQGFREAVVTAACVGSALDARDRLVVVPTRAAAAQLLRTIEDRMLPASSALFLPDIVTPNELVSRFAERLEATTPVLTEAEREVLLGLACRAASDAGAAPPFELRPGLIAEILRFYDTLRRRQNDVDAFERRVLDRLEPGALHDRGAERLVRQTRFLVAAFREFERRSSATGVDEHELRRRVATVAAGRPYRHVVLTVVDRAFDPHGLFAADWDLLTRVPGLAMLDVVVTDTTLAGALHERLHHVLPGIDEVRFEPNAAASIPKLLMPDVNSPVHRARDREEEVAGFARRVKAGAGDAHRAALSRMALVVRQPLPYVYVAREVLRSAGVPCQMFDTLPLAAEPYAAALDLVFSCVSADFARAPAIALLRSAHFRFGPRNGPPEGGPHVQGGPRVLDPRDVVALDRALSESGYLGGADALERLVESWRAAEPERGTIARALRAGAVLLGLTRELLPLRSAAPASEHVSRLLEFLTTHEDVPAPDDPVRSRRLRARGAVLATIAGLRDAYSRFDSTPTEFDRIAAVLRRSIEVQTFAPRTGDEGVQLVDAESARFGDFDFVQIAGVVDGEWPDRPRGNIFYSPGVLRELGWPAESDRLEAVRASFADLMRLPSQHLAVSLFTLEADALVSPSALIDEVERAGLDSVVEPIGSARIFEHEALAFDPVDLRSLAAAVGESASRRLGRPDRSGHRYRGVTSPREMPAYSLSALERFQDCPFKYFAADVLRLEEAPEDESMLSPRARGRFIHEVFQQFFAAWDARGPRRTITPDDIDAARALFAEVAEPLLARLPEADAALERARLFGSAIAVGIADVVLGVEASRPADVRERLLEYRLEGGFSLGPAAREVNLKGVADRIDLLSGNRLRVIDYKTGSAPNPRRALQVPIYALCAQERLAARDGAPWTIDDAAYVAFSGKRTLVPVVRPGATDADDVLDAARTRLFDAVDRIERGEFPPQPHDPIICTYCAFSTVCRKDYVDDQ